MNYIQVPGDSYKLIVRFKEKYPQYNQLFEDIESNLTQRLWHQLSDNLIFLAEKPELKNGTDLLELYSGLIVFIETAFNPMKLLMLIQRMLSNYQGKMGEAISFIENIEAKISFKGEEILYSKIIKGFCYLQLNRLYDLEDLLSNLKKEFDQKSEIDSIVYSNFYKLSTYFYDKKANYDEFYLNAFQYLAYEKNIEKDEKLALCFNMCIASLIGEKMFDFAELIEKDFFKMMIGTQYDWIYNLILSFNSAKVDQFISMLDTYADQINNNSVLKNHVDFLKKKIRIAALLDLVFQKNKNERTLTFNEICDTCLIEVEKIEYILIKSLSLQLIKGYIDQVEKKIVINWIQPKYLDKDKLSVLHGRFDNWIGRAHMMLNQFENSAAPLLG